MQMSRDTYNLRCARIESSRCGWRHLETDEIEARVISESNTQIALQDGYVLKPASVLVIHYDDPVWERHGMNGLVTSQVVRQFHGDSLRHICESSRRVVLYHSGRRQRG